MRIISILLSLALFFFWFGAASVDAREPELSPAERHKRAMDAAWASIKLANATVVSEIAAHEEALAAEAAAAEAAALAAAQAADSAVADTAGKAVTVTDTAVADTINMAVTVTDTAAADTINMTAVVTDTAAADTINMAAVVTDTAAADTAVKAAAPAPPPIKQATPTPPPPPRPPRTSPVFVPDIEMVFVKGGSFNMGCPPDDNSCIADERPVREVRLNNFFIGKYPVTQKQWGAVMGVIPSHFEGDDLPVEQVSWNDAQEFIKRLNAMTGKRYRLPTEAEWEYAARGGAEDNGQRFNGHRFLDDIAWHNYNSGGTTRSVGTKAPNELGLYDMMGNVWEWVGDWYDRFYYSASPLKNPTGPKSGKERVYRGQSFRTEERNCRVSMRNFNKPEYNAIDVGFRLALPSP